MTPATLETARELALDSLNAYAARENHLRLAYCDRRLTIIDRRNVRLFIAETHSVQKVVFAGSDDSRDWLGNLSAFKVTRTEVGRIHNGFADNYARVRRDLAEILDPAKRLVFAGHSLGGALAQIAAAQAARRGITVDCVHTFGAPMVGDSRWKTFYDACRIETHCWAVGWDRVPCHPSVLGFRLGYRPVSTGRFVALDGRLLSVRPGFLTSRTWKTWFKRKANHAMETYVEALGRTEVRPLLRAR
jgi:pimeloyl-ACP methyl ester carboxylesterase